MNIKKIIIILLIILIIAIIVLAALNWYGNYQEKYEYDPPEEDVAININSTIEKVSTRNDFYAVKTCIEKFYLYLAKTDESDYSIIDEETEQALEATDNMRKEAIYNMLDNNYIQNTGITKNNVLQHLGEIETSDVIIDDMYVSEQTENVAVYLVYGKLRNQTTRENTEFNLMLKIDMLNRTFKVIPADYINEYVGEISVGQELKLDIEETIEKNDYNIFAYETISEETYILDMFNEFKTDMMYDYETAYERLNEEYKQKRFETYEEFETYATEHIRNSVVMQLNQYQVNEFDNYTQYVCVDQNGKYYIFNETGVMDYTVILDTYTIDLPQFTEQYNNATDAEKVLYNLQKVFSAINDKDYNYVYNKLDNTFKQNNFPTLESFQTYITQNLYENNSIAYSNYQTSGNLHIYEISIKNAEDENSATVTKNFIMQLLDGTDFVMSFNV